MSKDKKHYQVSDNVFLLKKYFLLLFIATFKNYYPFCRIKIATFYQIVIAIFLR